MATIPDFSDKKTLEKYSSAITLSDMEIFVFPELFYPLVIANIMSPLKIPAKAVPKMIFKHILNVILTVFIA